jgi:hypothetical protein
MECKIIYDITGRPAQISYTFRIHFQKLGVRINLQAYIRNGNNEDGCLLGDRPDDGGSKDL